MTKPFNLCFSTAIVIFIALLFNSCKPPPPPAPVEPEFYSPSEIKPTKERSTIAIPTVENAMIEHSSSKILSLIIKNLTHAIYDDFRNNGRFDVVDHEKILAFESLRKENNTPLIDSLEDADLIPYVLAVSWNERDSYINCGCYLVVRKTGQVFERSNVKFDYIKEGNLIKFDDQQIYEFTLKCVRKFPRLKGTIISRNGKSVKIAIENRDKTFTGQQATVYNRYSILDPKFKSHEHSFIPVSEVMITNIQNDCLLGEVINGDENEIEAGDIIILK